MKLRLPFVRKLLIAVGLSGSILAQSQQTPPVPSFDPETNVLRLDWQSTRNRTFFPQASPDLNLWEYIGAIHFGTGPHVGMMQVNGDKAFFRLGYSDLPVASEAEAETADFDLDGLSNLRELQEAHTDPLDKDTDKDDLPDGWEVAHSISPRDDGSTDPSNGPNGVFVSSSSSESNIEPLAVITNQNAFDAGVQGHPSATMTDRDGDGLRDAVDAGPLSRAIDWEGGVGSIPRFIFQPLSGYDYSLHGIVLGCNGHGDVIAERARYSNGTWNSLGQILINEDEALNLKVRVHGREHPAFVKSQPLATSVADDGRILGYATVYFRSITEQNSSGGPVTYSPTATVMAFIWDSWNSVPRVFAHPSGSVVDGNMWSELARISKDGAVVLRRRADTTSESNPNYQFVRYDTSGTVSSTGGYAISLSYPAQGREGFQAFNVGFSNAFAWLPAEPAPRSLLADSRFLTPNSRSTYTPGLDPIYLGHKPGGGSTGHCINFWGKAMIRHEGQWQEAKELGDTTFITDRGIAFRGRNPAAVQVWNHRAKLPQGCG